MSEYDPIKAVDMADARDAVIEAAKAWRSEREQRYIGHGAPEAFDLASAVEALQEVE